MQTSDTFCEIIVKEYIHIYIHHHYLSSTKFLAVKKRDAWDFNQLDLYIVHALTLLALMPYWSVSWNMNKVTWCFHIFYLAWNQTGIKWSHLIAYQSWKIYPYLLNQQKLLAAIRTIMVSYYSLSIKQQQDDAQK